MPKLGWTPVKPKSHYGEDKRARDAAIAAVMRRLPIDFKLKVLEIILTLDKSEVIGEDIHVACENQGLFAPSPNNWGGLTLGFANRGVLNYTGRHSTTKFLPRHSREAKIYTIDKQACKLAITEEKRVVEAHQRRAEKAKVAIEKYRS